MIKREVIFGIITTTLISVSLLGCTNQISKTTINDTSTKIPFISAEPIKTEQPHQLTEAPNGVLEAYKAVLQNKAEFLSTDNKKSLYLNDFLTNKEIYGTTFKATRFAVLDMDDDKVPEVVVELSVDNNPEFYEVLHYMNETVYGYLIVYRGLEGLKADGTFRYSNGAADNGVGKLKFESDALKTEESFDSFITEQSGKEDADWHEFSLNNIESI